MLYGSLMSVIGRLHRRFQYEKKLLSDKIYKARYTTIKKKEFLSDLQVAVENNMGYAAGKIGYSQQHWMYYEIILSKKKTFDEIKEFEKSMNFHGLKQVGI